jgi:hypothetical protein
MIPVYKEAFKARATSLRARRVASQVMLAYFGDLSKEMKPYIYTVPVGLNISGANRTHLALTFI